MKFKHNYPFATPEAAEQKLLELANAVEADHAGRVPVGEINMQFRNAAAPLRNTARRWLPLSPMVGSSCTIGRLPDIHPSRGESVRLFRQERFPVS
jgi:hypothetical protein